MRRFAQIASGVVVLIVIVLLVAPFFIGRWFEHSYKKSLMSYAHWQVKTEIKNYKRHWFSSDATLVLTVKNPDLLSIFTALGIEPKDIPTQYTITQFIQHGPVIYHFLNDFSSLFGWVAIQNTVQLPPDLKIFEGEIQTSEMTIGTWVYPQHLNHAVYLYMDIAKLQVEEESIGPIHLQIKIAELNAKALADLVTAYQLIIQRGELYESQLRKKMFLMLPNVITAHSTLTLDTLNITTPDGKLQMDGSVSWAKNEASLPDELGELLKDAVVRANIKISKKVVDKWIKFVSSSSYFNVVDQKEQARYFDLRKKMQRAMRQNAVFIVSLVQNQLLEEPAALDLLALQKQLVPIDRYANEIRDLLLTKQISLETSYLLYWRYMPVQRLMSFLENQFFQAEEKMQKQMRTQLNEWIKNHYIKQDKNNYTVFFERTRENIKMNGYTVKN